MGKKSFSREAAETKEGLEVVKNEVPESMMQQDQQIQNTDAAQKTEGAASSFQPKKSAAKGQTLKQQVISDAITGSSNAAGMGISAAGRGVSGTAGGVLGANNSTPHAEKSRSGSRVGKKLDRVATKLNYTPSETCLLAVDESKPLADAADEDQGYNGTYRNEFGRSQKIMGAVPGDLMFQRSVDLILKDKLYFVEGQQVYQVAGDRTAFDPQRVADVHHIDQTLPTTIHSGNYLHRGMHFGLDASGQVQYCYFDVADLTHAVVDADDANAASAHRLAKANVAELDRMSMDAKAGDEKADIWTPLARAIEDPTKWSYLMSSIEADTGAYAYLAYSKASTNMAYQLNRGPKDGLEIEIPAMEQLIGWRASVDTSTAFKDASAGRANVKALFNDANYCLGDPSLMIDAYDSVSKYNNKADLLLQPRGWRMHLQTADNNINALRIPAEFANVYAGTEVFSTIDRDYDPLLPICMTDKANLITVHNFNELAAFYNNAGYLRLDGKVSYSHLVGSGAYAHTDVILAKADAMKKMGWTEAHIYVCYNVTGSEEAQQLDDIILDTTTNVVYLDGDTSNRTNAPYSVLVSPVEIDLTSEEFEDWVELTAAPIDVSQNTADIAVRVPKVDSTGLNKVTASNYVVDDIANDWHYVGCNALAYAYSDLRNNYLVEVRHPLIEGIKQYLNESIGAKIRSLIKQTDFYIPLIFSTQYMTLAQLIICAATPWIQRVRYNSMKDVIYYQENVGSYPYSKLSAIKEVPFKNYVNFTYTDYDSPLQTKIMNPVQAINWIMPEFFWKVATEKYVLPWYFCENDLLADGTVNPDASTMCMPSIRSGIRLGALDTLYGMSEKDIRLSLDRMTKTFLRDTDISSFNAYKYGRMTDGQILANLASNKVFSLQKILACPRELGLCMDAPLGVLTVDPADGAGFTTALKALTADGTATSYRIKMWLNPNTILHPVPLAADGVNINRAANYSQKWYEITANGATSNCDVAGLIFGMGDDPATYSPFAVLGTGASAGNGVNIRSLQRSIYTRLQLLPFVISPFDSVGAGLVQDIYDFAYFFGLCGFRASDYRESVYNREKEVVNQGLSFVSDPWVEASPILKGASASTGVANVKGYVLR